MSHSLSDTLNKFIIDFTEGKYAVEVAHGVSGALRIRLVKTT